MQNFTMSLAAARVNAELTQAEAAKRLGISGVTLITYEKGKVIPKPAMMQEIAKVYGIPAENIDFLRHAVK